MRSEKLRQRRRREYSVFIIGAFVVAVFLFAGVIWFLHRPNFTISEVIVNGNHVISDKKIQDAVETVIIGKYFFLFPRSNIFIYPEEELEARILTLFKQIRSVELVRTGFHTLTIEVREQEPLALWCSFLGEGVSDECYFLNASGFIFSKAPNFTGNVFFRFYDGDVGATPIGATYLNSPERFKRLVALVDTLRELEIVPIELHHIEEGDMELYLEDGSKLIFGQDQESSDIVSNLSAVLKSESFQNESVGNIEYIDLRFGNKVYFKVRN